MTVRSEKIENGQRVKQSALFRRSALVRGRNAFERIVGLALLLGSIAGNVLAFNGGKLWPIQAGAWLGGIGVQAGLTAIQWFYCPHTPSDAPRIVRLFYWLRGLRWQYVGSVAVGAGLSVAGYRVVLLGVFDRLFTGLHWSYTDTTLAAWGLLIMVSLVVEVIPENILVE